MTRQSLSLVKTVSKSRLVLTTHLYKFPTGSLAINYLWTTKKSKFMIFSSKMKNYNLSSLTIGLANKNLEGVKSYKYLGVILDPHLTFQHHVAYIRGKTIGKLKMLGWVRRVMDQETFINLYKSLVIPLFDYCDVVYDGLRQNDIDTLQKLQNAACRIILSCDSRTHISDLHEALNLELLQSRRSRHTAHEMYKVYHQLTPLKILDMFVHPVNVHQRNTFCTISKFWYTKVPTHTDSKVV